MLVDFCQGKRYSKAIFSACSTVASLRFAGTKLQQYVDISHLWGGDKPKERKRSPAGREWRAGDSRPTGCSVPVGTLEC